MRAGAYYNIARIYEAAGQFADALRHYQLAKEQKANPLINSETRFTDNAPQWRVVCLSGGYRREAASRSINPRP